MRTVSDGRIPEIFFAVGAMEGPGWEIVAGALDGGNSRLAPERKRWCEVPRRRRWRRVGGRCWGGCGRVVCGWPVERLAWRVEEAGVGLRPGCRWRLSFGGSSSPLRSRSDRASCSMPAAASGLHSIDPQSFEDGIALLHKPVETDRVASMEPQSFDHGMGPPQNTPPHPHLQAIFRAVPIPPRFLPLHCHFLSAFFMLSP